jgi:hypothetical protein
MRYQALTGLNAGQRPGQDSDATLGDEALTRRPWYVWAAPLTVIAVTLCIRNAFLFNTHIYEMADFGADSILVERARHFTLLVGNYSRDGFYHPGPAYFYVTAAGESLFYDVLHVVPTPWNGQVISLYLLDSLLAGLLVLVVYGWARLRGALAALALLLVWAVLHTGIYSAVWLPYQDIPAFSLFLVAAGSVAAGHSRDGWIATLAGWLLIHRYAVMLLFVPVIGALALLMAIWPHRRRLRAAARDLMHTPKVWVPVLAISAISALPIALETFLHWPGQFGHYLSYSHSAKAGAHGAGDTMTYIFWFWGNGVYRWIFSIGAVVCCIAAPLLTRPPVRRYLAMLGVLLLVATGLFAYYAATGIDEINQHYIGYFYWGVPLSAALIVTLAVVSLLDRIARLMTLAMAAGAAAALGVFAAAPGTVTPTTTVDPQTPPRIPSATDPGLAAAVQLLAHDAHGKPIVIYLDHLAWPEMTGFLVQAERTGVTACAADPRYQILVTTNFICTRREIRNGAWFKFRDIGARVRHPIVVLRQAIVISYVPAFARHTRHRHHHRRVRHHRTRTMDRKPGSGERERMTWG